MNKANRWMALIGNSGVLVGLILLAYEVHQNSELTLAQISMDRTNINMQILADLANGGDLLPIDVKLREGVKDFPKTINWSQVLTAEEQRRYQFWMYMRLIELNNDWFQCDVGLLPQEICLKDVRHNMRSSIHRFYEFDIPFTRSRSSFVTEMQELARLEGLPSINDDGTWQ